MRFNRRHRLTGHLFAGRYKSLLIDGADPEYLRVACDYVHLNPARAAMLAAGERLERYSWSSYPDYLSSPALRPAWLRVDRVFGKHGLRGESRRDRLEFGWRNEAVRRDGDNRAMYADLRAGWYNGAEDFLARLLDRLEGKLRKETHRGRERIESGAAKAERIIARKLAAIGWGGRRLAGADERCAGKNRTGGATRGAHGDDTAGNHHAPFDGRALEPFKASV